MKKILLLLAVGLLSVAATVPQFFYYSDIRRAIAVRDDEEGSVIVKNRLNQIVLTYQYNPNTSRWVSVSRLAPGQYTAQTTNGSLISFYKRP